MIELGRRTEMIPRDTVHHYTEWNPTGERQRMYTGDEQESVLINAVRLALDHLAPAIELCKDLHDLEVNDPIFADYLQALDEHLEYFGHVMSTVVERVTPEFFAHSLRPYFEEVIIAGVSHLGPAAAHVPLYIVDLALWASDHGSSDYETFIHESVRHTLPDWRPLLPYFDAKPSLVTRVSLALEAALDDNKELRNSADALGGVLHTLRLFRSKHLSMAKRTYREETRLYPLGSGGGDVELLRTIRDLVRDNAELVVVPRSTEAESLEHFKMNGQ